MHIVIVGGGFAGIRAALELSKRNLGRITLISDQPHFLNRSTLNSTALKGNESESVIALGSIFSKHHDVNVVQDSIVSLDPDRKLAVGKRKGYSYDKLILALGSTADYANIPGANKHTFDVRTLDHVRKLHSRIAKECLDDKHGESTYTIVGGGSTAVEIAGSLAEYVNNLKQLHSPRRAKLRVVIMERQSRLLPNYSQTASKVITGRLRQLGVEVLTGHEVAKIDSKTVVVGKLKLASETTIWATGTQNNPFFAKQPAYFQLDKYGNVLVNPYLEAYKNIFVLGDNANVHLINSTRKAIDMGTFIAKHLTRVAADKHLRPFRTRPHMLTISVGDDWAYAQYLGIYAKGCLGQSLLRHQTLKNYRQIISKYQALAAWKSRDKHPVD